MGGRLSSAVMHEMMMSKNESYTPSNQELTMLRMVQNEFGDHHDLSERTSDGFLRVKLLNHNTDNYLELSYDKDLLVLGIGDWCHDHPDSVQEALDMMNRIIQCKIIIWKVTRPNGHWYSGFYDIDEYEENMELVDEPDTGLEAGDRIERSSFSEVLEDRVVE